MVLIAALSGSAERLESATDYVRELAEPWYHAPEGFESKHTWLDALLAKASDVGALESFVYAQAAKLKVDKLKSVCIPW